MLYAHRLTGDARYYTAALQNADYIFGRNATGYCYLTGFGTHSPMHPHHRPSAADDIAAPFPGLLVGGPNPGQSDHNATSTFTYPSKQPDESYIDVTESYASNEIAINWNASLLALLVILIFQKSPNKNATINRKKTPQITEQKHLKQPKKSINVWLFDI